MKDISGQVIYYYSINYSKTIVDDLYQESPEKVFEHPIEIAARVTWQPAESKTTDFGHEEKRTLEVYIHVRDVIERKINIVPGDFISYGNAFYEITSAVIADNVFGQVEYSMGYKLTCVQSNANDFMTKLIGPTWEGYADDDAVKRDFYQQRGFPSNKEGPTGDVRDLVRKGVLDEPISGPAEVSRRGSDVPNDSSFYDEPDE